MIDKTWSSESTCQNPAPMVQIRKSQAKLYRSLRRDMVQHLLFGLVVFVIVLCFFTFNAWYKGMVEFQETMVYRRKAFLLIFGETLLYTLAMGVPVFFNLYFFYKRRIQDYLKWPFLNEAEIKGWAFYFFLLFSCLTAILFTFPMTELFQHFLEIITPKWYGNLLIILLLILCTSGVSYTKETIERNRNFERMERQEQIRRQRRVEQELRFIKKQIRPHFLFNTLANLQILAGQKSDLLPDLMGRLSSLLRYLLYETNEKLVPLENELDFLRSYVELEKLQLSQTVDFKFEVIGNGPFTGKIAPMILLVFVENCFKHYNKGNGGTKFIHLQLHVTDHHLELITANTFKTNAQNEDNFENRSGGVGMSSAKEKLQLIYKDNFSLACETGGNVFKLKLQLPLL